MNEKIKYLGFIFLIVIVFYFFINNNQHENFENYQVTSNKCNINRTNYPCEGKYLGWESTDITERFSRSIDIDNNIDSYSKNACDSHYDKICLDKSTDASSCRENCEILPNCGSFSIENNDNGFSKCCYFNIGWNGSYTDSSSPNEKCYTKKKCEYNKLITDGSCICKGSNALNETTCSNYSICESNGENASCINSSSDNVNEKIYDNLRKLSGENIKKICTTEENVSNEAKGIPFCICKYDGLTPEELGMTLPDDPTEEDYNDRICPYENDICNYKSFEPYNLGCYRLTPNSSGSIQTCKYNSIDGRDNIRDSDILISTDYPVDKDCFCNINPSGVAVIETNIHHSESICEFDNNKYCRAIDNSCQDLIPCVKSDSFLKESCLYNLNGVSTMCNYLNSSGIKDKFFDNNSSEKCKTINNCMEFDSIIGENGHCFCQLPNSEDIKHLCFPDHICSSERGCIERQVCPDGFTYNESLDSCIQPPCQYYSEENSSAITSECICDTDPNHTDDNPFVCQINHYCLKNDLRSNIPFTGCQTFSNLKEKCSEYSSTNIDPISKECYCGETESGEPYNCVSGKYCVDNVCKKISCQDDKHIIDPDDHTKCITKNILEVRGYQGSQFDEFINNIKDLFNEILDKIK